jgi:hypothetical protein
VGAGWCALLCWATSPLCRAYGAVAILEKLPETISGVILESKLGIALSLLRTLLPIIPDHY